jgi:hypothetical protein
MAKTIANAAPFAPVMNHLWPLITHTSPSQVAVVLIGDEWLQVRALLPRRTS